MLELDHLALTASTLADGVAAVEEALGVDLAGGGEHPKMGTHNRLLGLGDVYLEVIAINPDAAGPDHPRWFDLDNFTGAPRLTNWICRTDNLEAAIEASPDGMGVPVALSRADFSWRMVVPADGKLPFDNAYPALIQWEGLAHPAARLPDVGCRLLRLEITHPEALALKAAMAGNLNDARVVISQGDALAYRAEIETPHGVRVLG
ncbi:MAG: VOC family protein [Marinosulfonomonas sp.]|nr:VOC family protein [Marinosulfonomonas sp.]